MVLVLLLLFLKNLCIFLNKIVLRIYNSYFIHPNSTDKLISNSVIINDNNNQCRNYRSSLSSSGNVSMRARLQEGEGRGKKKSTAIRSFSLPTISTDKISMRARLLEGEGRGKKSTALRRRMLEAQKKDTQSFP